jgi:DMSO reductase anchor subunit
MDPNAPKAAATPSEKRSLSNVQRWVMSVLAVSTILHMALGLILLTAVIDNPQPGAAEGLCVIAGVFGVLAVVTGRVIHGAKPLSPWLALGIIPTLIGFWFINL